MKHLFSVLALLVGVLALQSQACCSDTLGRSERLALENAWMTFLEAVSKNDIMKIRRISHCSIRCLLCVDNTKEEEKELERFMEREQGWYNKLYAERIFIPIDQFCKNDFPLLFTTAFIEKLKSGKPTFILEQINGEKVYEVLIPTSQPEELARGHEGRLHVFQFIKAKNAYKFWGVDTVP